MPSTEKNVEKNQKNPKSEIFKIENFQNSKSKNFKIENLNFQNHFLHDKIIFFDQDFFYTKVWVVSFDSAGSRTPIIIVGVRTPWVLPMLRIDGIESVKYFIHYLWVYARARAIVTCDCDNWGYRGFCQNSATFEPLVLRNASIILNHPTTVVLSYVYD